MAATRDHYNSIWKLVVPGSQDAEVMVKNPLLRCQRIRALI